MFDFGVGYSELLVLAIVAIIVIGPKDLPQVLRTFGRMMNKARGMAREFQGHVDAAMRESGVSDLKKDLQSLRGVVEKQVSDVAPTKVAAPVPYAATVARKDFDALFGAEAAAGETRVAGTVVAEPLARP